MPLSKNNKLYYTEEQFQKARYDSSALEYARAQGYNLIQRGKYHTLAEHDSMVFTERGTWFWNSRDLKGGAIEFITAYEHKPFVDAVLILAGENVKTQEAAYYNSVAFVFQDEKERAVGAFMRSTGSGEGSKMFRGMARNSDRQIGCFYFGAKDSTVACVFEAAIDAMSYASIQKLIGNPDWAGRYYVASGGAGDSNIMYFLSHHPEVDTVFLCQDNDPAGNKMAGALSEKLRQKGYNVTRLAPEGKDFNDDLRKKLGMERQDFPEQRQTEETPSEKAQYPDDVDNDTLMMD